LFEEGKSFNVFPFKVVYKTTIFKDSFLKAGFTASKKNFKRATDRNRIKRLMRESFRLQKNELANALHANNKYLAVFFIYTGNTLPKYIEVMGKIKTVLKRLEKIANENDHENS